MSHWRDLEFLASQILEILSVTPSGLRDSTNKDSGDIFINWKAIKKTACNPESKFWEGLHNALRRKIQFKPC